MNIHLHSISQSASWFKTQIPSVTTQQKKIFVVVAFALSCLALCYYAVKRYCFKAKPVEFKANPIEYPVKTWNLRMDSTYKQLSRLIPNYEWVTGTANAEKFMGMEEDRHMITAVTGFACARIPPHGVDPNSLLYIGDLITYARTNDQIKAVVRTVSNSKEHIRAIFSTLFTIMNTNHDPITRRLTYGKLQDVVYILTHEELINVIALDNRAPDSMAFYQQEQYEIGRIEVHNYLHYQQIFESRPEFIVKCHQLAQYAEYIRVEATREAREVGKLVY